MVELHNAHSVLPKIVVDRFVLMMYDRGRGWGWLCLYTMVKSNPVPPFSSIVYAFRFFVNKKKNKIIFDELAFSMYDRGRGGAGSFGFY